jgi:hypothetical protein
MASKEQIHTFNPREHLIELKSKQGAQEYLPVQWRLVWFREVCPEGEILTELITLDLDRDTQEEVYAWNAETRRSEKMIKRAKGYAMFKATVKDGKGGSATGYKSEKAASFSEYAEKAETGAIGRALAALGFGTQFAPELNEEHRIVDAPVDRSTSATDGNGDGRKPLASVRSATVGSSIKANGTTAEEGEAPASATDQQLTSIRKLRQHLGKPEPEHPETMSYQDAKALITQLSHEYNEQKLHRKAS